MTDAPQLWLASLAFLLAFIALGFSLTYSAILRADGWAAARMRARGVALAALLTASGRAMPLLALAVAGTLGFALARAPMRGALALDAAQLLSQGLVEVAKSAFFRARPADWLLRRDAGYSYPSGHAATAVVFFGGWALLLARSGMPAPMHDVAAAALLCWGVGIAWSRIALGAHHLSDVAGGALFGAAALCAMLALEHGLPTPHPR